MKAIRTVAVLVGSLRKDSLNRKLARALAELAPSTLKFEFIEIGDLALYNQDLEPDAPSSWLEFRKRVKAADAVLFVTPEYNRSVPGVLKNAIDVGSRPSVQNAWARKPAAVISVSPGALGAFGANHHLRQSLVSLNVPTMPQPEAYIGGAGDLFDAEGKITKDKTRDLLQQFVNAFDQWVSLQLDASGPSPT